MYSLFFGLWVLTAAGLPMEERDLITVNGAADIRTKFSDGADTVYDLTKRAKDLGIESIVINDHLTYELEYGIFPFQNIFKYKKTLSSLKVNGYQNYFDEVARVQKQIPEVIIIPGIEISPFYWWSGSFFDRSIKLHDWEFHIAIVGMEDPEVISNIPAVHNLFTDAPDEKQASKIIIFSITLFLSLLYWLFDRGKISGFLLLINALLLINNYPSPGPEINIYKPPDGVKPYQKAIDYIKEHNAISIWHHMEAINGITKKGGLDFHTPPHPTDLIRTTGYTGLQALYEDTITATNPGKEWDITLIEYIVGKRDNPPWAYGGLDYHGVSENGPKLRNIKHFYWVDHKSKEEIIEAMRVGRFYTEREGENYRFQLNEFSLSSPENRNKSAISGEVIDVTRRPAVKLNISTTDDLKHKGTIFIIHNGKVAVEREFTTPYKKVFFLKQEKTPNNLSYVRLMVKGERPNQIISNPIFYRTPGKK